MPIPRESEPILHLKWQTALPVPLTKAKPTLPPELHSTMVEMSSVNRDGPCSTASPGAARLIQGHITRPQSCATSLETHLLHPPFSCASLTSYKKLLSSSHSPTFPLPGFCSFLCPTSIAITCQQLCFEFLTFSTKSKLSLNKAHHFQSTLCLFIPNSQLHQAELHHLSPPSWLLSSPWKHMGERSRHHTSKIRVFLFVCTLQPQGSHISPEDRDLPSQTGWVHTTPDGQTTLISGDSPQSEKNYSLGGK